jgi:hypothetical protein
MLVAGTLSMIGLGASMGAWSFGRPTHHHSRRPHHPCFQVLVATDVAGRGLHISNLPYLVSYDMPPSLEAYVHRWAQRRRPPEPTKPTAAGSAASSGGAQRAAASPHPHLQ